MINAKREQLSASLEDYLEAIYRLSEAENQARSKDIAERLGVSRASVTGALRLLKKKGLANYEPYDVVTLTPSGRDAAAEVDRKHRILKSFFGEVLGVDSDLAQKAACRVEHTLGPTIIGRLLCFIDFVNHENVAGNDLVAKFQKFCSDRAV